MSHLVDWFSDDHFDRIFWKSWDMVWIGLVDPEEWMHSSYRTSSKHFTPLYRNYIEQKQNISIVCSFQINIMIVLTTYILHIMHKQHIAYTHQSPFRPLTCWHLPHLPIVFLPRLESSPTMPQLPPHRAMTRAAEHPQHPCLTDVPHHGARSRRFFRFGFTRMSAGRYFCWTPRKHPRKEKKIVSL